MPATISRVISFGRKRPGNEDGSDDEVRLGDRLLDLERVGHQQGDARAEHLLQVPHAIDRALQDRHLGAEPEGDDGGVVADHPAADHDRLPGCNAGHAAEQQPSAASRLLEERRSGL